MSARRRSFENLIMRFEEPSSMVRWDSPLITLSPDESPPYDEIWNIITKGEKKAPNAAVVQVRSAYPYLQYRQAKVEW